VTGVDGVVKYYFRKKNHLRKPTSESFSLSLLRAFGSVAGWVYSMAFGGFDELVRRRDRQGFIAEVNRSFSYLFSEHEGSVHPHEGENLPRAFDYVSVVLEFKEMSVRLTSGRGELDAEVAPARAPNDWRELRFLWQVADPSDGTDVPWISSSLEGFASQLQGSWHQLAFVLSEENWFPTLTLAEWRRFVRLPSAEKLAVRESMAPKQRKLTSINAFNQRP
jgi:hypothetical protein